MGHSSILLYINFIFKKVVKSDDEVTMLPMNQPLSSIKCVHKTLTIHCAFLVFTDCQSHMVTDQVTKVIFEMDTVRKGILHV